MGVSYILNDDGSVSKVGNDEIDMSEVKSKVIDFVNHPPHYTRSGALECIEEMILIFGEEAVANYCLCNAWKYRYRAYEKNGFEDISKSDWYVKKYKELKDVIEKKKSHPRKISYRSYCGEDDD